MYDVTMPKLSDSMEEGKIIAWKVKEGDVVHEGDVLAEVESDKAVMELECFHGGVMAEIKFGDDAEAPVGAVIATIAPEGEAPGKKEEKKETTTTKAPKHKEEKAPRKKEATTTKVPRHEEKTADSKIPKPPPEPARAPHSALRTPQSALSSAVSPYAKKLAADHGLDWSLIKGSGPDGRVVADDVEQAIKVLKPTPKAAPAPPADEELPELDIREGEADVAPASFRLRTQARRVTSSKHVIPHFYLTRAVDVTALLARKVELKEQHGATVTHLIMRACIKALEQNPAANRSYDRGKIIAWKGINLGLAAATDEGLTVAVVRNAQDLSLAELIERSKDLVARARTGKLSADERRHPSFTITNLGMFDVEHFEPIINPPSSITLGVATAKPEAVVKGDTLRIGQVMRLTASCDHRIIDGVTAAKFVASLVELLEHPDELLA